MRRVAKSHIIEPGRLQLDDSAMSRLIAPTLTLALAVCVAAPALAQNTMATTDADVSERDAVLNAPAAVGFVSTTAPDRARKFYGEVLGLSLTDDGYALIADVGGAQLRITTVPQFTASEAPVFGFNVADVPSTAARLRVRGVEPIRYAFLGDAQDAEGIWTSPDGKKLFWFNDPDGNLLVLGTR